MRVFAQSTTHQSPFTTHPVGVQATQEFLKRNYRIKFWKAKYNIENEVTLPMLKEFYLGLLEEFGEHAQYFVMETATNTIESEALDYKTKKKKE